MRRWHGAALLLAAIVLASYWPVHRAGFVFDDDTQILGNPQVRELRNFPRAITQPVWAFQHPDKGAYFRPVQMGTYNLLWAAGGEDPAPFHALNVLLHACNAVLLLLLTRRLTGSLTAGIVAAALFAAHPATSEAVVWIASLPELSYTAFGLSALLVLASHPGALSWRPVTLAAVLFLLALLSKETALALLPVIGLQLLAQSRREPSPWNRTLTMLLPFLGAAVLFLGLHVAAVGRLAQGPTAGPIENPLVAQPPFVRAATAMGNLGRYLTLLVAPWRFSIDYSYRSIEPERSLLAPWTWVGIAALAIGVGLTARTLSRREHAVSLGLAMLYLPLLPVLGFPIPPASFMGDRYLYLPTAGFSLLVAIAAAPLLAGGPVRRKARTMLPAALAGIVILAGWRTHRRAAEWRDNVSIYGAALRVFPDNVRMLSNLGHEYFAAGRLEEARRLLVRAADIAPTFADNLVNLANVEASSGELDRALATYTRALSLNPRDALARANRGRVLLALGRRQEALDDLSEAVRLDPTYTSAAAQLGTLLLQSGRREEAIRTFQAVLEQDPENETARRGLALAQGRP